MEFERFKKFWERPEERVVTSNNVSSWDCFWDRLASNEDNFSIPSVSNALGESLIKTSPHTCVSDALDESRTYYYERIDMEIINKVIGDFFSEKGPKEKITWIDMAEKDTIESYKRQQIGGILMGNKKEMVMNRLELEIKELRDSTEENYMLNKMVNTDGNEFFVEYTLYKDYNKYFGLTLEGDSIEVVNIMEEEFAEFLHQYRLSITYPQVQAVHEDEDKYLEIDVNNLSGLTVEEYLEYVKQGIAPMLGSEDALIEDLIATAAKQLVESKLAKFSPMYNEDDIEDEIKIDGEYDMNKLGVNVDHGSDLDIDKTYVNIPSMWTETPTNTGEMTKNSWTETSSNTSGVRAGMWKSNQPIEDNSKESFISKIVADVMEELLTKGTCSLNITLGQE